MQSGTTTSGFHSFGAVAVALEAKLLDPDVSVRAAAARALLSIASRPGSPKPTVLERLESLPPIAQVALLKALTDPTTLPLMLRLADSPTASVRAAALGSAAAMGKALGDEETRTEIGARLEAALAHDESPAVRAAAVRAFESIPTPGRVTALLGALGDPTVRETALSVLEHTGWTAESDTGVALIALARSDFATLLGLGAAAVPFLAGALRDRDRDKESVLLRARALETLAGIGPSFGGDAALSAITLALDDVGSGARAAAARALCRFAVAVPDPTVLRLVDLLRTDYDALVRRNAAVAIGVIFRARQDLDRPASDPSLFSAVNGALKAAAIGDADATARFAASESLAQLGDTARLLEELGSPDAETRRAAAVALGELVAEEAIDPLISVLGDGTTSVRAAAFGALERIGWTPVGVKRDPADPRYARWMTRAEQESRVAAIEPEPVDVAVEPEPVDASDDPDSSEPTTVEPTPDAALDEAVPALVPKRAVRATSEVRRARVVAAQARLLQGDLRSSDALVRQAALEALGRTGNTELAALAVRHLDDESAGVRRAAADALASLETPPVEPAPLARFLVALDRRAEAAALGDAAIAPLLEATSDPRSSVRADALRLLATLGLLVAEPASEDPPTDPDDELATNAVVTTSLRPDVEDALRKGLGDSDDGVRSICVAGLLPLGDGVAATLGPLLSDPTASIRQQVGMAIAGLGPVGLDVLAAALGDSADVVREAAALAIPASPLGAQLGTSLSARCQQDPATSVRVASASALGALKLAPETLLTALEADLDFAVRDAAATALGEFATPGDGETDDVPVLAGLIRALGDSYSVVRRAALAALARHGWFPEGAVAKAMLALSAGDWKTLVEVGPEALPLLAQTLGERGLDSITAERRLRAAETVLTIGERHGADHASGLLRVALDDESWRVRKVAASGAHRLGLTDLADPLLVLAKSDPSDEVKATAARALGRCGNRNQIEDLRAIARSASAPEVRLAASQALAGPALGEIAPLLIALAAPEADVRQGAAEELGSLGNPKAIDSLLATLGDATASVRGAARTALLKLGWVPFGVRASAEARGFDRWVSREELHPVAVDTPQREVMEAALGHVDDSLRAAIAAGLGQLDDPKAIPALERLKRDPNEAVRAAALDALRELRPRG
ncbi:MAG: HEAT repeat domain-containing protein [Myxococcales bacterium]|nr:HEAT repeat domain-containing protein [Myxococcales bacterium]